MQLQLKALSLLCFFIATASWAESDQEQIKKLFSRYDQVVSEHKLQLMPEVFSPKFLSDVGGEKEFSNTVKSEKPKLLPYSLEIKPGAKDRSMAFVKRIPRGSKERPDTAFIVKRNPSGEWRIEGTIGDDN